MKSGEMNLCYKLLLSACELLEEGFGCVVSFSSPLPNTCISGKFLWEVLVFKYKGHHSNTYQVCAPEHVVQSCSCKDVMSKISNNSFCFGNRPTVLLKIFTNLQAGQSHWGRFRKSGYSLAKGVQWKQSREQECWVPGSMIWKKLVTAVLILECT